ncbi:MAG: hypothetical protein EXS05_06580 [Planctomycetaceae bacterium]|nr:hypothetical protein [Planctomycetaceae bacterium]
MHKKAKTPAVLRTLLASFLISLPASPSGFSAPPRLPDLPRVRKMPDLPTVPRSGLPLSEGAKRGDTIRRFLERTEDIMDAASSATSVEPAARQSARDPLGPDRRRAVIPHVNFRWEMLEAHLNVVILLDTAPDVHQTVSTYRSLAELFAAIGRCNNSSPDVTTIRNRFGDMRSNPKLKPLAERVQLDLAVRIFLNGQSRVSRELLPSVADSHQASALLREATADFLARDTDQDDLERSSEETRVYPALSFEAIQAPIARELQQTRTMLLNDVSQEWKDILNQSFIEFPEPFGTKDSQGDDDILASQYLALATRTLDQTNYDLRFDGMTARYSRVLAGFLQLELTQPERVIIRNMRRNGNSIREIGERIAEGRFALAAKNSDQIAGAFRRDSYARLPIEDVEKARTLLQGLAPANAAVDDDLRPPWADGWTRILTARIAQLIADQALPILPSEKEPTPEAAP